MDAITPITERPDKSERMNNKEIGIERFGKVCGKEQPTSRLAGPIDADDDGVDWSKPVHGLTERFWPRVSCHLTIVCHIPLRRQSRWALGSGRQRRGQDRTFGPAHCPQHRVKL